jgi:hypothetical protein
MPAMSTMVSTHNQVMAKPPIQINIMGWGNMCGAINCASMFAAFLSIRPNEPHANIGKVIRGVTFHAHRNQDDPRKNAGSASPVQ